MPLEILLRLSLSIVQKSARWQGGQQEAKPGHVALIMCEVSAGIRTLLPYELDGEVALRG